MKNLLVLTILVFGSTSLASSPAIADRKQAIVEVPPNSRLSCDQAIANVKADLTSRGFFKGYTGPGSVPEFRNPQIRFDKERIQRGYKNYPKNRLETISYSTVGADDLHNSPKFMAKLAAQIMAECDRIGLVEFYDYEGGSLVGYFPDHTARTFIFQQLQVRQTPEGYPETLPFDWGYYYEP